MQELFEKAISIALAAHKGQKDKGGSPYILHPLRVMFSVETTEEKIVALLHDVVEDSTITIQQLNEENFSKNILAAVTLLTKKENQSYDNYIRAIKKNKLATKVKKEDLKDNMNIARLKTVNQKDKERLIKYKLALKYLNE